ncbi:hydrolase [Photobacterium sp. SDRW27]|uniref:esterase/lipase family protein n=1 Tax=Photobacterium obscurum TaxID=2829490 RepID=UPI002243E389|nr:hydrolase [Photobacterium obscurum]MCW8328964.1 hydrolase [Photobacterium obscurum]
MKVLGSQSFSIKISRLLTASLILLTVGCTPHSSYSSINHTLASNNETIKKPLRVPGLKACTSVPDTTVDIDPNATLNIIVHGCFSSAGKFRALADVYKSQNQQALCFEYDDRDDLELVSGKLISALNQLTESNPDQQLHIIGHSQGGLIARRALITNREDQQTVLANNIHLTTIASPFNGIMASSHCGMGSLRVLSLGIVDLICYAVTGKKYQQITPYSDFMNTPGELIPSVSKHLMIKTDEVNSCRHFGDNGLCLEDDYVFSLDEQSNYTIASFDEVTELTVKAGHVEIVGNETVAPTILINILKEQQLLLINDNISELELTRLIEQIYRNHQFSI